MRIAISLIGILLLVTGCPGTASSSGGRGGGDAADQNSDGTQGVTEPTDPTQPEGPPQPDVQPEPDSPTEPDTPTEPDVPDETDTLPDLTEEVPVGADFFLALINGLPDDWTVVAEGSDNISVASFQVDDAGVYTIELTISTADAGDAEATGISITDAGFERLPDPLPLISSAVNLTIDVTPLIERDPLAPSFALAVILGPQ
ncbi:MAG: hypothetical protein ACE5HE_14705 [Phycisphaerae bacterium]